MESFDELGDCVDQLKDISRHLLDAESHHNQSEELNEKLKDMEG